MKTLKSKGKCLIALVMAVIMLAGVCLPAAAWSVGEDDEGLCYTLSYKDGMLSLVIDAEMLYEVMKDKSITKDELDRFLPSDVIDTLQKGGELSPEDLTSLISSYITVNDVLEMVEDMPKELLVEFFDPELINKLIDIKELLELLDIDKIMSAISEQSLKDVLAIDGVMEKVLEGDRLTNLLSPNFISDKIENSGMLDDDNIKRALLGLINDEKIAEIEKDYPDVWDKVANYMMTDGDVINKIVAGAHDEKNDDIQNLFRYVLEFDPDDGNGDDITTPHGKFNKFIEDIEDMLMKPEHIVEYMTHPEVLTELIENGTVTIVNINKVFDEHTSSLASFVNMEELWKEQNFVNQFKGNNAKLLKDVINSDAAVKTAVETAFKEALGTSVSYTDIYGWGVVDEAKAKELALEKLSFEYAQTSGIVVITLDENNSAAVEAAKQEMIDKFGFDTLKAAADHAQIDIIDINNISADDMVNLFVALNTEYGVSLENIEALSFVDFELTNSNISDLIDELDNDSGFTVESLLKNDYLDTVLANVDLSIFTGSENVKNTILNSDAAKNKIINSNEFSEYWNSNSQNLVQYIDVDGLVEWMLGDDVKITGDDINTLIGNKSHKEVLDSISHDTLELMFKDFMGTAEDGEIQFFLETFVEIYDPMGNKDLIDKAMGGYAAVIEKYADFKKLVETIDVDNLIDIFGLNNIINAIGIEYILNKGYVEIKEIIEQAENGAVGFIDAFSPEELIEIVKLVGIDGWRNFINANKESGLLEALNLKKLATDVINHVRENSGDIKQALKDIAANAYRVLMTRIDTVDINGTAVFHHAKIDLNNAVISILSAFPENLQDIVDNGLSLSAGVTLKDYDEDGNKVTGSTYSYGISVSFSGEKDNLRDLLCDFNDNFNFDFTVGENGALNIDLDVVLPAVVSGIYEKLLTTDRLPEDIRQELVRLSGSTLGEASGVFERIAKNQELYDTVIEKIEEIRAKAYEKIDAKLSDNAAVQKAKAKVDDILAKISDKDKYDAIVDKVMGYFDKAASGRENISLLDALYEGDGRFFAEYAFESFDIIEFIESKGIDIPSKVEMLFQNTSFTGKVSADVTVSDLYRVDFTDENGSEFTTLLTSGMSLDIIADVTGYDGVFMTDDPDTGDSVQISVMPARDLVIYAEKEPEKPTRDITFTDENGEEIKVTVPVDATVDEIVEAIRDAMEEKTGAEYTDDLVIIGGDNEIVNVKELEEWPDDVAAVYSADSYYVQYVIEDGAGNVVEILKTVFYAKGDSKEDIEPDPDNLTWDGKDTAKYEYFWENYMLFTEQKTVVALQQREIEQGEDTRQVILDLKDADGELLGRITFTLVGDETPSYADVLNAAKRELGTKDGYEMSIDYTTLEEAEKNGITVTYTPLPYYIKWYDADGKVIKKVEWNLDDKPTPEEREAPEAPTRKGYIFAGWSVTPTDEMFNKAADVEIYPKWDYEYYKATFVGHDGSKQEVEFTVKDIQNGRLSKEPEVPYKYGHEGVWEEYKLDYKDITVNAQYTLKVYTATFVADGVVVATVQFTVNDTKLTEPLVPAKDGYLGNWEEYEITDSDIIIEAIYSPFSTQADADDDDGEVTIFGITVKTKYIGWIALILLAMLIGGGVGGYIYNDRKKSAPEPEPDPDPEPTPEPEPEPEVEPEPEPEIEVVESVSADAVDTLMTDSAAMKLLKVKRTGSGAGMKVAINLDAINDAFEAGETVTLEALKEKGIAPAKAQRVKILARGTIDKPLNVEADSFSVQAVKMITLTGGTATQTVYEEA